MEQQSKGSVSMHQGQTEASKHMALMHRDSVTLKREKSQSEVKAEGQMDLGCPSPIA